MVLKAVTIMAHSLELFLVPFGFDTLCQDISETDDDASGCHDAQEFTTFHVYDDLLDSALMIAIGDCLN